MLATTIRRLLRSQQWLGLLVLALLTGALVLLTPMAAQSAAPRYVEVAETSGDVTFQGEPVRAGDRLPATTSGGLRTGADGRARLMMDDTIGSVDVDPDTELSVSGLDTLDSGGKTTAFQLARGRARVRVRRFNNPDSRFDVRTPSGNAGVRGTEFTVYVKPDGEMQMSVLDGLVMLTGQNQQAEPVECRPGTAWIVPASAEPIVGGSIFDDTNVRLELLDGNQSGQVRIVARTNPTNAVQLNGNAVQVSRQGQFEQVVPIPGDRRIRFQIRDLFNREQTYELVVPESVETLDGEAESEPEDEDAEDEDAEDEDAEDEANAETDAAGPAVVVPGESAAPETEAAS